MNSLFHRIALFTVLVVVCTLVATTGIVSALNTYDMTLTTDSNIYGVNSEVTICGEITNTTTSTGAPGLLVAIKVTDSSGETAFQTIAVTASNGSYSTSFIHPSGDSQRTGTYTVMANAAIDGNQIAIKTTTYTVDASIPEFSSSVFILTAFIGGCAAVALAMLSVKKTSNSKQDS